jgi:alpha-L-rhamnosidase
VQDPKAKECTVPDPWLRKTFDLTVRPAKAVLFVASVGYHEVYVNGRRIGDDVLVPCVSDHLKRARYVAYDIASALKPGKNVIALWLGTSWSIFPSYASDDKPRAPIVIAQADIYNVERPGVSQVRPVLRIQTDSSWKTYPSPNKLLGRWDFLQMGGEIWDANKEVPDWNLASCNETGWKAVTVYHPRLLLSAQMVEPNRLFQEIHPVSVETNPDGSFRVDMGVNFAGWTEVKCKGPQGQRVDMYFSEREKEEMTFHLHNAFIIGKTGEGVFRNRFNYSSGRWITIRGMRKRPAIGDIRGWVVRTAYPSAATFSCSDSLQNWIYDRVRWNFENLSIGGYVVDCPQRERMGYGGDAHSTSETGVFNYGLGAFYTKWMEDWRDVQGAKNMDPRNYGGKADSGILPHTAPTYWGGGGPGWGGICVTLPWLMYQQEGDRRILEKNFKLIKNWLAFLDTHTRNDLLERFGGTWDFLGDWLWPHAGVEGMNNDKPQNICFNNCYRVFNLRTAARIARVLGKDAEAEQWERQAAASSLAIQAKYYNTGDHSYSDSSMGNLAAALLAEVPPPGLHAAVMDRLAQEILVVRNGHIHVGITGGAMLFKLLRSAGRDDLIYSMTSQKDYPGWGYMKANGATSLWEMWEKDLPGHSLLHSSYLYPGAWYIDGLGGIRRDPDHPGFGQFIVRPPRAGATTVSWARASYDSPMGMIRTAWQRKEGRLYLEVTVPPGTAAKVLFPSADPSGIRVSSSLARYKGTEGGYSVYELPAGRYVLEGKEAVPL